MKHRLETLHRLVCLLLLGLVALQLHSQRPQVIVGERKAGYRSSKTWKPAIFQGGHRKAAYYEGWYFKCVADDGRSFALIPGIALGQKGQPSHAFIQYIDGKTAATQWFEFAADEFRYSQKRFYVEIGRNFFSADSVHVDVGEGADRLLADLGFSDLHPWPVKAFSPGIMGWYRFVPGMETCHGLVSWHHRVRGRLQHQGQDIVMHDGRGYIEKDWGSSFPRSYIWMQSNSFGQDATSFMCSIATIPYLGKYFTGFLGFLWVNGRLYQFATYTHAKLEAMEIGDNAVSLEVKERQFRIEVQAKRQSSGVLKAPQAGQMERRISESVDAVIHIRLLDRQGGLLFERDGVAAGLEIVGDRAELVEQL